MYASVNQWSFGGGMTPPECLRAAKELGFSGFEPAFGETGVLSAEGFAADAKALREEAAALGIAIPSLASGVYWQHPYSHADAAERQRAIGLTRAQIDCAVELGAKSVLVVPATVGKGFFGTGVGYADAYSRAQDALAAVAEHAKQAGVVIGVENVWNNFLLSPLEAARFLDEIGSPYVKMYFDVGNIVPYGEGADWIRILGARICAIHVKDFRRAVGTIDGFVPLLEGDVDWPAVLDALRGVGFDGALTAEVGTVPAEPLFGARQAAAALETILRNG